MACRTREPQDDDDGEKSEGFWREFFLLRPDGSTLRRMVAAIPPEHLPQLESQTRQLFSRAVAALKNATHGGAADLHALDVSRAATLFLPEVVVWWCLGEGW